MTLDQIKQALQDRNLHRVAEATDLHPHTLYRIMSGKTKPHGSTLATLTKYLKG